VFAFLHQHKYRALKSSIKKQFFLFFFSLQVIIKSITLQTLYLNSMWFPPNSSLLAFLNQAIFIILSGLTAFNFVMAAVLGPSYLPYGWKPKNKKHESYLQPCTVCPDTFKAPRAHHCRKCDRCVAKMVRKSFSFILLINEINFDIISRTITAFILTIVLDMEITLISFGSFPLPSLVALTLPSFS
jgi:hypothetical protein